MCCFLTKNEKYYTDCVEGWNKKELQTALEKLPESYDSLMEGQLKTHKEIYDRVSMSLNAPEDERLMTNEELLAKQKNRAHRFWPCTRRSLRQADTITCPPAAMWRLRICWVCGLEIQM